MVVAERTRPEVAVNQQRYGPVLDIRRRSYRTMAGGMRRKMTPQDVAIALDMYEDGMEIKEIAAFFTCGRTTIMVELRPYLEPKSG